MPGVRAAPSDLVAASIQPKSGSARLLVDEERHDEHDGVGAGHGVGVVGGGAEPAGGDELGELLLQVRPRRGTARCPALTRSTVRWDDVDADDVVALAGELDGERQPDLAEGDDGDLQGVSPG